MPVVPEFAAFDQRGYPTVATRDGYAGWQPSYEAVVQDMMDLRILDLISTVKWEESKQVADLGCGTGRTAAWLVAKGVRVIDGVDLTPEMLAQARHRRLHRHLFEADVRSTPLETGVYDLAICSLVDEHLPELGALYREAGRLLGAGGTFVVVGYHTFFIMGSGMPTHFNDSDGRPVAIETYVHLPSEHMAAARSAAFTATELLEGVIDDEWIRNKPKWERYREWPISFAWVWRM